MAHFNKRHYEAMARALRASYPNPVHEISVQQWWRDVHYIAAAFTNDNQDFAYDKFINACDPSI